MHKITTAGLRFTERRTGDSSMLVNFLSTTIVTWTWKILPQVSRRLAPRHVHDFYSFMHFFIRLQDQTVFDVADPTILKSLEELKKKQQILFKDDPQLILKKEQSIPKKRYVSAIESFFLPIIKSFIYSLSSNSDNTTTIVGQEGDESFEVETPNKVKRFEFEIESEKDDCSAGGGGGGGDGGEGDGATNNDVGKFIYYNILLFKTIAKNIFGM